MIVKLRIIFNLLELLFEALLFALCSETVASQYFLELAKYVGLPVISWNADNSALEKVKEKVRDVAKRCANSRLVNSEHLDN